MRMKWTYPKGVRSNAELPNLTEGLLKLGFSTQRTMSVAQKLYENGFITYMRTDSATLSETAISAARAQVRELYGSDFLPEKARTYAS